VRSRQVRLVVSLVVASLLATVLVYTALAGNVRVVQVADLEKQPSLGLKTVRLNGRVVPGSVHGDAYSASGMRFQLEDNATGQGRLLVVYHGQVPDAFQAGRAILIDGRLSDGRFAAKNDSLSTKCPSKYQAAPSSGSAAKPAGGSGSGA
jgi:cytochrome c-type biogenesis protein CcmE